MSESNENSRRESSRKRGHQPDTSTEENETSHPPVETANEGGDEPTSGRSTQEPPFSRHQWENLPSDPDIHTDLGYRATEWEMIETLDNSNQVIFMPEDEELLKDDAFIVAREDVTCDLGEHY